MTDNEYLKIINTLPEKINLFPGIIASPSPIPDADAIYINSKCIIKIVKPLQSIVDADFRSVMMIFGSIGLNVRIWDVYDLNNLNDISPEILEIYKSMKVSPIDIFETKNQDTNILFRSSLCIDDKKSIAVNIDLFKKISMDADTFIDNILENNRMKLVGIYLKEFINIITKTFNTKQDVINLIKNNSKFNRNINDHNLKDMDMIYNQIWKTISDIFLNNMVSMYVSNKSASLDSYFNDPTVQIKNSYKSIEDITKMNDIYSITKTAIDNLDLIIIPDGEFEKVIGFKLFDKIYLFQCYDDIVDINDSRETNELINDCICKLKGCGCCNILSSLGIPLETDIDWKDRVINKIHNTYNTMSKKVNITWSIPNILTRHISTLPTHVHYSKYIKLHIVVDSSASMSDEDLRKINFIIKQFSIEKIPMIIYVHDDSSNGQIKITEINNEIDVDDFIKHRYANGGTSHDGVFKVLEEQFSSPKSIATSIILVCSDLYSDINQCYDKYKWPRKVPTYFITRTTDIRPDFGETILIH